MKKAMSVFLALIMVLLTFSSCKDGSGSDTSGNSSKSKDKSTAEVFTIAKTAYHEELDEWNSDGEYGEAMRQLFSEIEGEYNIKIKVDYYAPTEFQGIAQAAITNGDSSFADIVIMNLFAFGPMYAQGLLMNTSELSGLDIKSDVWSKATVDLATFKDGNYGLGNDGFSGASGLAAYYNKTMLKSLGLEDPEKLVKDGKWTWDKMRELSMKAVKDLNNDGKFTDADRFGCTSASYDGLVPTFLTSGVETIVKDNTGRLVYNMMNNDLASKALQKFKSTYTISDGMFFDAGLDGLKQQHQFLSGKCLFMLGGWTTDEEPDENINIGVLPLPKYSANDPYRAPGFHNNSIVVVPKTAERKELIGKVLQLIGEKTKTFSDLRINDYSVKFVDREPVVEMLKNYIYPNFSIDLFNIMLNANESISIGTMRAIGTPIMTDEPSSQFIQGQASTIQSVLDDMFNKG